MPSTAVHYGTAAPGSGSGSSSCSLAPVQVVGGRGRTRAFRCTDTRCASSSAVLWASILPKTGSSASSSEAVFHHGRFRFNRRSESSVAYRGSKNGVSVPLPGCERQGGWSHARMTALQSFSWNKRCYRHRSWTDESPITPRKRRSRPLIAFGATINSGNGREPLHSRYRKKPQDGRLQPYQVFPTSGLRNHPEQCRPSACPRLRPSV